MTKGSNEISAVEAARILGVGLDYLYRLIWSNKIVARKVENRWRVSTASVESRLLALKAQND
jgi:excisionase family DNA binding protein